MDAEDLSVWADLRSVGTGVFLILGFVAGYLLDPVIQADTLRTLLSVMIGAQASVLAIVVSVTLISTQLVATRYAPRMATLPFRTPLFKGAFLLFAGSIVLDVLLLVEVLPASSPFFGGLLFFAVGLFFAILLFLYFFVRGMVATTSPENLVTLFTETISTDEYLSKAQALADAPGRNAHPLRPLYRFVMSALSKGEHGTASAALGQYEDFALEIMNDLGERGTFSDDSLDCGSELFGPVLKEQLHEIAVHAAEQDESRIIASAVDIQVALGKRGMEFGGKTHAPGQALSGLRHTAIDSPVTTEDYNTFNLAWPAVAELMLAEVQYEQHTVLLGGSNLINDTLGSALERSNEPNWHGTALRELFDDLCEAHLTVLKNIAKDHEFDDIDLSKDPTTHEMPASDRVEQARFSRQAIEGASSTFLQFRIDEGDYPLPAGNFRRELKTLCVSVADQGAEDQAVRLCQMVIEIAFFENINAPYEPHGAAKSGIFTETSTDSLFWARHLAEIRTETDAPIVDRAFENVLQYDYREGSAPLRVFGADDETEDEFYFSSIVPDDSRALNTYSNYPDLVRELRELSEQQ